MKDFFLIICKMKPEILHCKIKVSMFLKKLIYIRIYLNELR